jgi:bifunctional polynucleotide phosphatase/kinase
MIKLQDNAKSKPNKMQANDYLYTYIPSGLPLKPEILWMFDLDGTLTANPNGNPYKSDDIVFFGNIKKMVKQLEDTGAVVAIISNQSAWDSFSGNKEKFKKLETELPSVIQMVATGKYSPYRKPNPLIYNELLRILQTTHRDLKEVYFCGDAAGADHPFPPYRWADSDKGFAEAIGAVFKTPDQVIPKCILPPPKAEQELIIMVGNPGSGKSTTCRHYESLGYEIINQDTLGTRAKVLKTLKTKWAEGKSCIIDSTNPSTEKRLEYIDICRNLTLDVRVRVFWHIRDGRPFNDLRLPEHRVGAIVYNIYTKHFEHPELDATFLKIHDKNRITYEVCTIY